MSATVVAVGQGLLRVVNPLLDSLLFVLLLLYCRRQVVGALARRAAGTLSPMRARLTLLLFRDVPWIFALALVVLWLIGPQGVRGRFVAFEPISSGLRDAAIGLISAGWLLVTLWFLAIAARGYRDLVVATGQGLVKLVAFVLLLAWGDEFLRQMGLLHHARTLVSKVLMTSSPTQPPLLLGQILFLYFSYWVPAVERFGYWRTEFFAATLGHGELASHGGLRRATLAFGFASQVLPARLTREEFGDALEQAEALAQAGAKSWRIDRLWIGTVAVAFGNTLRDLPRWLSERRRTRGGRS